MKLNDFDYNLPQSLIAQKPARPRDHSRLLVVETQKLKHRRFHEIVKFLRPGDVLILNDSKVLAGRLIGKKPAPPSLPPSRKATEGQRKLRKTGSGRVEILLLKEIENGRWEALIKNLKEKTGLGQKIVIRRGFTALAIKNLGSGVWEIKFNIGGKKLTRAMKKFGQAPVPP
ncbi:MAG: S-adenosylmethionine:tRNA ribosyltransferase-isomerase, partial [bacterium]|nr:S-adenosylmethionine:tRNA ribosyltransferase-isomerase [bacterium]